MPARSLFVVSLVVPLVTFAQDLTPESAGPIAFVNAPRFTYPFDGVHQLGNATEITGTGDPASEVTVLDGHARVIGVTRVGADGQWSLATELAGGPWRLSATARQLTAVSPPTNVTFLIEERLLVEGGGCSSAPMLASVALLAWLWRRRSAG
ncbi:MAG: hypothetical protein U0228_34420 [Myxococcaceae bacterium]